MKYNPDSYSEYPILRPHSDDYPEAEFRAMLVKLSQDNDAIHLHLDFQVAETSIENEVRSGDSICCAHIYCGSTRYSEMVVANDGEFSVERLVSLKNIRGLVEIRPLVLTMNQIEVNTETAHPDYGGARIQVDRYRQRAVCEPYHFRVGYIGAVESVFRIEKSDDLDLDRGEFEYDADPSEKYIRIKMTHETYQDFQEVRRHEHFARMTVYLNALTDALGRLPEESDDDELAEGWAATIREHLKKSNLDVPYKHSCGFAAQRLLGSPLERLPHIISIEGEENG